jgi:predicted nucleic acid-binding protein
LKQVLDTRFLIEYHYSQDAQMRKKTLQKLKEVTQNSNGIIPTIVMLETIQIIAQKEGKENAEMVYIWLGTIGLKIESLNPSIAKEAGILKSIYRQLPVGDCIIAATAIKNQANIVSDDTHFDEIREVKRTWL